jgi:hypothetical protein
MLFGTLVTPIEMGELDRTNPPWQFPSSMSTVPELSPAIARSGQLSLLKSNPGCTLRPPEFTLAFNITAFGHLTGLAGTVSAVVVGGTAQSGALAAHNQNPTAIARLRAYFWHLSDTESSEKSLKCLLRSTYWNDFSRQIPAASLGA